MKSGSSWMNWWDHPRVCGEKPSQKGCGSCPAGSPPRVRGKVAVYLSHDKRRGITPAHAGKSQFICRFVLARGDHPRACGEKMTRPPSSWPNMGSPPRMRGKGHDGQPGRLFRGITPAYAGKRGSGSLPRSCRRDHPRVCGEKSKLFPVDDAVKGSPPHMRGKGQNQRGTGSGRGITPAYAGKSTHQPPSGRGTRGHPRVCGEKCGYRLPFRSIVGSPPTVRGKDRRAERTGRIPGITPACAGKS